jgi:hypothetical protein
VGIWLGFAALSPPLVYVAMRLLNDDKPKSNRKYAVVVLSVLLAIVAALLIFNR